MATTTHQLWKERHDVLHVHAAGTPRFLVRQFSGSGPGQTCGVRSLDHEVRRRTKRGCLSDAIKKAVLVRGCPEPLTTRLQMNLQTYVSHGSIRNAVQSYTEAKRTWRSEAAQASSCTVMEVDAMCKDGHKGQSKGGKVKSKNPKGDECDICGKRGHVQEHCWCPPRIRSSK